MPRKALSALLIFSWIILSGLDVVEDLDLPDQTEFQNSTEAASRGSGPSGPLARNIVESATDGGSRCSSWLEQLTAPTISYTPYFSQKVSKLHKIHRVFLI